MPATTVDGVRYTTSSHDPWVHNGEDELTQALKRLKIPFEYETRFYPLEYRRANASESTAGGFTPDFHLPAHQGRPAINIELTFADHGRPEMLQAQRQANLERLKLKRLKIELTSRVHGIETILITYGMFMSIRRDPRVLERLIIEAARRHRRSERPRGRGYRLPRQAA